MPRSRRPKNRSCPDPSRYTLPTIIATNDFTRPGTHGTLWTPSHPPRPSHHHPEERLPAPPPASSSSSNDGRLTRYADSSPGSGGEQAPSAGPGRHDAPRQHVSFAPAPVPVLRVPVQHEKEKERRPMAMTDESKKLLVKARAARMAAVLDAWDQRWEAACALPAPPEDEAEEVDGCVEQMGALAVSVQAEDAAIPPGGGGGMALPKVAEEEGEEDARREKDSYEVQVAQLRAKIPWLVGQRTVGGAGWRPFGEYYWDR